MPNIIGKLVGTNAHILITHGTGLLVSGCIEAFTIVYIFLNFCISSSLRKTFLPYYSAIFSAYLYSWSTFCIYSICSFV